MKWSVVSNFHYKFDKMTFCYMYFWRSVIWHPDHPLIFFSTFFFSTLSLIFLFFCSYLQMQSGEGRQIILAPISLKKISNKIFKKTEKVFLTFLFKLNKSTYVYFILNVYSLSKCYRCLNKKCPNQIQNSERVIF